jgi:hypothetical protein
MEPASPGIRLFSGQTELHPGGFRELTEIRIASLAGAGDLNGDGFPDYAIGGSSAQSQQGYVMMFSGKDGALLHKATAARCPWFGHAVCVIANANGVDRFGIVVGCPDLNEPSRNTGQVFVYSSANSDIIYKCVSDEPTFGQHVLTIGDVDGDGIEDFAVAAPGKFDSKGAVSVYSGKVGTPLYQVIGKRENAQFGASLAVVAHYSAGGLAPKDGRQNKPTDYLLAIGTDPLDADTPGSVELVNAKSGTHVREILAPPTAK